MNDQSIKKDGNKLRLTTVPPWMIYAVARVREYGIEKYGFDESWRKVETERYRDALARHTVKYLADPSAIDDESGLPALWHIACNVAFLCEIEDFDEKRKVGERL